MNFLRWRVLRWVVLAVVVLVIGGVLALYLSLNSIIRSTVQSQTAQQLKVDTKLGAARFSLFGGNLSLSNFELGSPKGFAAPRMLEMNRAAVDVSYGQLRSDPIRIQDITIDKPVLVVEQAGGQVNYKALLDQLPPKPEGQQPMNLVIGTLRISEPSVVLRPGLPFLQQEIRVPLQTIEMKDVGSGKGAENGAAIQQVLMQVIAAMAQAAANSDRIPPELRNVLAVDPQALAAKAGERAKEELAKVQQDLEKRLGAPATQAIGDVLKQTTGQEDAGKAFEKELGGLLKGKEGKKK